MAASYIASMHHAQGYFDALVSSLLFGLMSYSVYRMAGHVSAPQLAFLRAAASILILTPLVLGEMRRAFRPGSRFLWVRAVAGAISILCYFWTLQHGEVGTARIYSDVAPVFVLLIAVLFYGEKMHRDEVIGLLIVVGAVSLLHLQESAPVRPGQTSPLVLMAVGLGGSLCMGVSLTSLKQASAHFSTNLIVWCLGIGIFLISAPFAIQQWVTPARQDWGWIMATCFSGIAAQIYRTKSFVLLKAPVASAMALTVVFFNVLFVGVLDGQWPRVSEYVVYALAIGGILLMRKPRPEA